VKHSIEPQIRDFVLKAFKSTLQTIKTTIPACRPSERVHRKPSNRFQNILNLASKDSPSHSTSKCYLHCQNCFHQFFSFYFYLCFYFCWSFFHWIFLNFFHDIRRQDFPTEYNHFSSCLLFFFS
jgi:hypothetical protein